jgi:hypothetical protein
MKRKNSNGIGDINEVSQSLGRIEQKIDDLNIQMSDISENGCNFGRKTEKGLANHLTGHKIVYVVVTILAGIAAWVISNFGKLQ